MQSYCERVCPCQVTQECNQKTKSMQAELALLMIGKQFPYDEVVSQHTYSGHPHCCLTSILWHSFTLPLPPSHVPEPDQQKA